jgi:cell division protein FtsI/penicillin-binding protein 2
MNIPPYSNLRLGLLFVGICCCYSMIMVRLLWIQILYHGFFVSLGQKQYVTTCSRQPARACIYDRNGVALALNHTYMSACLAPRALQNPDAVYQFLEHYFPEARERLARALSFT